jgi:hypothetical protein
MGTAVMIIGPSGVGKSASLRNLPDDKYSLIEVNGKPLPFKSKKKFVHTDKYEEITALLGRAKSDIIVIDDSQYLMANEFMRRGKEKGFEKFTDIGTSFWELINTVSKLPPNKIVYFLHHSDVDQYGNVTMKTIGKLLSEKVSLEGMFTILLRAGKSDGRYYFSTQSDGLDPVKTPMDMFSEQYIDNDIAIVDSAIREYYGLQAEVKKDANTLV